MRNYFKSSIILIFLLPSLAHAELSPSSQMFRIGKISIEFGQSSLITELRHNDDYQIECHDQKQSKECSNSQGVNVISMDHGFKWMTALCNVNNTCEIKAETLFSDICLIQPDFDRGVCDTKEMFGGVSTSEWQVLAEDNDLRAHCLVSEKVLFCIQEAKSTGNVSVYSWQKL